MFSYYGSKSKIIHLYPEPQYDRIIEPFAGSARYALKYWDRDVLLCDLSDHVYQVWQYLLRASERDIRSLPNVPSKVSLDTYTTLTPPERYLIGFHLCRGKAKPRRTGHGQNGWARDKERIASNLFKIRHWDVRQISFNEVNNQWATWFIDPPYRQIQLRNSDRYEHWQVDYVELAAFAQTRLGQVIVCEGDGADWLPFTKLADVHTNTNGKTVKTNGEWVYLR